MDKLSVVYAIFLSLFILICVVIFTGMLLLMTALSGAIHYIYFIITIASCLYLAFVLYTFRFFKTKKRIQLYWGIVAIAISVSAIQPIMHTYKANIPTVDAEVNVYEYEPFVEGNQVATLGQQASLQLKENLPKIDGATALYPLYAAFVQATYPEDYYNPYDSEVMVSKTPQAYSNLINGDVDLIVALGPSESQKNQAASRGLELKLTPIGREAFVFFVHQKNKVNGLTLQQIKDIYTGNVTDWSEVGGEKDVIRAFQRPQDSGSQTALQTLMGDVPIMEAPTEDIATGMGGIINEVAQYKNYKNAIGYTFRFYSTEMVGNSEIKLLEINDVAPSEETIRTGTYPITSEFYIVTAGTENPNVDQFIDWVLSAEGQQLVEEVGYVPVIQ